MTGKQFCAASRHDTFICGRTASGTCRTCSRISNKKYKEDNIEQHRAAGRAYYDSHKLQARKNHLKRTYGLSLEDYNKMLMAQNNCCLVCGRDQSKLSRNLSVDHDHKTGKIRGLLCDVCNGFLGIVQDDVKKLLAYIR